MLTDFWKHKGWIALIPLAMAALAFFAWIAIGSDARQMERRGIEAEATIVDTRRVMRPATTSTGSGTVARVSANYYVTVMFPTGSALEDTLEIQQVEHFVDRSYYERVDTGDRVWVRYLPDDPERIELEPGGTQSNSNAAGWVGLGMLVCAGLLGGLIWTHAAKVHRFKTTGGTVKATVTGITKQNGWTILSLTLPDGRSVKALPLRADDGTFHPGATIDVLSHPHHPEQVMIPPTA
ncbi:DUF3592 domain-containing protein [Flavimaricola marinus]|uniref:DUF3592 domain-containing protein n=1 Tax=Flavimaricola marinus TaxID=1819565 RepID=A0A238LEX2_9RHOB|nr:DUF3592 domain-containing protein [Flavimaricola marinus]SMY07965.1 hypothetical protein LOM8899_02110 [Flavimaricola marinus]